MPDTPSITLVKRFTYRGLPEEFSNTYHFSGTTPANDAAWLALGEKIWSSEKTLHTPATSLVKIYGYAAGNEHSIFQKDYVADGTTLIPGNFPIDSSVRRMSGDQAAWLRAKIGVSSTGKKVYIRKYFHDGTVDPAAPDAISQGAYRDRLAAHGSYMLGGASGFVTGALPGSAVWCGPQGQTASNPTFSNFVTTRSLKRRGKRP